MTRFQCVPFVWEDVWKMHCDVLNCTDVLQHTSDILCRAFTPTSTFSYLVSAKQPSSLVLFRHRNTQGKTRKRNFILVENLVWLLSRFVSPHSTLLHYLVTDMLLFLNYLRTKNSVTLVIPISQGPQYSVISLYLRQFWDSSWFRHTPVSCWDLTEKLF